MNFLSKRLPVAIGLALWLAHAAVPATLADPSDRLLVFAGEDSAARAGDAEALQRLAAAQGRSGWLVKVAKQWFVTPPQLIATIYLQPTSQTARLRRGESLRALSPDPPTAAWSLLPSRPRRNAYAQVSLPDHPFDGKPEMPGTLDGPFMVTGDISDEDIVAVVDYVRANPNSTQMRALPDGPHGERSFEIFGGGTVDGTNPISQLQNTDPATVIITTRRRPGAGQTITVQKVDGHWRVKSVGEWMA